MSSRNTAIFVPGHVQAEELARVLWAPGNLDPALFADDEAIRSGCGTVAGKAYTLITARVFAIAGFAVLDRADLPPDSDLEMVIGRSLSEVFGEVLFLCYDDERGWGGFARFEKGQCTDRQVVDGRDSRPVARSMEGDTELSDVDESEWVWPRMSEIVEAGATKMLGPGIRTDDEIEERVVAAEVAAIPTPASTAPAQDQPTGSGVRARLKRWIRG